MQKVTDVPQDSGKYYIVITPFFPSGESFRGPYIYDQVQAIARNSEYKVVVFAPCRSNEKQEIYEYGGIKVHLFPMRNMPSYFFNGILNSYNAHKFLKTFYKCGIPGKQIKYVHCHTSTFGALGVALKKQYPHIRVLLQHHSRDPFTILNGKLSAWLPNLWFRAMMNVRLFENIDIHISISKIVNDNLHLFPSASPLEDYVPYIKKLIRIKRMSSPRIARSIVLYNGVDKNKFYPLKKNQTTGLFKIGCIANFQTLKDQITLIKATEELINNHGLTDIKVSFIGSGPELRKCKNYVTDAGLNRYIQFDSEVDHSQLCTYYNTLDLFVLPSVYEGFGCVFTEAYACGVPFMICEGQGATEYLSSPEYDKWVFQKHNYHQLAEMIHTFACQRFRQKLQISHDIDFLIARFLKQIDDFHE